MDDIKMVVYSKLIKRVKMDSIGLISSLATHENLRDKLNIAQRLQFSSMNRLPPTNLYLHS
jgi:hypothetical protein